MDVIRFGLSQRALRLRRRLTQAQLAARAGVSRSVIGRIERGRVDRVAMHTVEAVASQLEARMDVRLLWHGEGLDRLLDSGHASLVERMLAFLRSAGWEVAAEVSFNIRGERGSIDVLGFHAATRSLLVVGVKSVVPDLQAMLAGLDRKARLGRAPARERGWHAATVSRILVLPDDRTARRRIESHSVTFGSALPARTAAVKRWVRNPDGAIEGILFLADGHEAGMRHRARPSPASVH